LALRYTETPAKLGTLSVANDQTRVGQVHLVLGQLHRRRRHADDDHQRHEQLRHRHAEVACAPT
jgi:hypothetical protein